MKLEALRIPFDRLESPDHVAKRIGKLAPHVGSCPVLPVLPGEPGPEQGRGFEKPVENVGAASSEVGLQDVLILVAGGSGQAQLAGPVAGRVSRSVPLSDLGGLRGGGGGGQLGVQHAPVARVGAAAPRVGNANLGCHGRADGP